VRKASLKDSKNDKEPIGSVAQLACLRFVYLTYCRLCSRRFVQESSAKQKGHKIFLKVLKGKK